MSFSSSALLKRPSSATAVAHGTFCAPGMCPPRCAPSCGRFSGARSSPAYSFGERTSTIFVPFPETTLSSTWSRSARIDASGVPALREAGNVVREWPLLGDPLRPSAVHELHVLVPVVLQEPEEPGREPVVVIAVRDDRRRRRHPVLRQQLLELFLVEEIAHGMLLQIGLPVEADRAGHVTLVVGARVDVDLEDSYVAILRMLGEPIGLDEHVLRVIRHVIPLSISF